MEPLVVEEGEVLLPALTFAACNRISPLKFSSTYVQNEKNDKECEKDLKYFEEDVNWMWTECEVDLNGKW